jgi:hypothetical protein
LRRWIWQTPMIPQCTPAMILLGTRVSFVDSVRTIRLAQEQMSRPQREIADNHAKQR